jgi:hypothetical protein
MHLCLFVFAFISGSEAPPDKYSKSSRRKEWREEWETDESKFTQKTTRTIVEKVEEASSWILMVLSVFYCGLVICRALDASITMT